MDLRIKYGTCLIPKETILFSAIVDSDRYDYIFFGLKYFIAKAFKDENRKVVAFKLNRDLEILFMLKEMNRRQHYISCGDEIFKNFFPDNSSDIDDLRIKQDKALLDKMITLLSSQKINGWLTSLENNPELEICIFGNQINNDLFTIIDSVDLDVEYEFYDALKYIQIFPSEDFISESKSNFSNDFKTFRKQNINCANCLIRDDGYSKERAEFELYNMRYKLKI